jgi:hypothetical protein
MTNKQPQLRYITKVVRLLEAQLYDEAETIIFKEAWKLEASVLKRVKKLLKNKYYNEASKFIEKMPINNFSEVKSLVHLVLTDRTLPINVQDVVLQKFLDAQKDHSMAGNWEHDLRALTPIMWELRLMKWLEKFYLAVFKKAKARRRSMYGSIYIAELVHQFAEFARWSDDPAKFGLTIKNLPQDIQLRESSFVLARLKASPFNSEKDFLLWRLERAMVRKESLEDIHSRLMKLCETDFEIRKVIHLEGKIIKKYSRILIRKIRSPMDSRIRLDLASDTDRILRFLTKLAFDQKRFSKKPRVGKGLPNATQKKKNYSNR